MTDSTDSIDLQSDRLGEILHDGDRVGLRYERTFRHPIDRVWRALHDSDDLRHWLPVDIVGERAAGATIDLPFWPEVTVKYPEETGPSSLPGRIVTWDPPHLFEWMWDTDELRFELTETTDGCRLVFTTWIDKTPGVEKTAAGYHVCLHALRTLLDDGIEGSVVDHDTAAIEARYQALLDADAD